MPFSAFGLHADILRGIKDLAFTHPTPIQKAAIGPAMEGRDVLAVAATGSGKTAAFMLPTIHRLMTKPPTRRAVRALVLTPTRELAAQILDHLNLMATHTSISGAIIIGGLSMGQQAHAFRTGTEILIATPGRLLDHLRQPYAKLDALEVLVLDEADRMLDMGFIPDIRRILRAIPPKRQTLFFSATMPPEIRQLTQEMLKDPATIQIDRTAAPAAGITQAIYPVPQHLKTALLKKMLDGPALESVIVFLRTKHRANRLAASLTASGFSCVPIHGNRSQGQRTAAIAGFKSGQYRVLVATDIAARGIDIADVTHVVNFDCPHMAEDYIHRIGRTGRASAMGDAFTFVADDEMGNLRTIERAINKRLPRITLPDFDYTQKQTERLEVPIADRIAAIRAQKSRANANRGRGSGGGGYPRDNRNAAPMAHDGAPPRSDGNSGNRHKPQGQGRPQNAPAGAPGGRPSFTPNRPAPGGGAGHAPHSGGPGKKHRPGGGKFGQRPGGKFTGPAGRNEYSGPRH